ncbi:AMP-binding protein [Ectothiorhodospiraceae bacterium 2226]|nr:AMP-binding protein [Ectothiorhodospiraceae bacterium 2226]
MDSEALPTASNNARRAAQKPASIEVPDTLQALVRGLMRHGDRPAVVQMSREGSEDLSFRALAEEARRLGAGLCARGLQPQTPVMLFAPNSPAWLIACLAVAEAGAVTMPLDAQLGDEELGGVLADSGVQWIFTTRALAERLTALDEAPRDATLILLDGEPEDTRSWRHWQAAAPEELPAVAPDAPAALFYTSGTTGAPKGVPLTHANLMSNLRALLAQNLAYPSDRLLSPLPLHHVYPFAIGLLAPLALGAAMVLPYSLTGPQILRALQAGRVSVIVGVPRLYQALFDAIEGRLRAANPVLLRVFRALLRLSIWLRRYLGISIGRRLFAFLHRRFAPHLRMVASGGSALDGELAWKLEGLGWQVASGYGLTETSPILTYNPPGSGRPESPGRALPGVELRVAPPAEGQTHGEVQARGPNVFAGYRNRPDKTREVFTDDGWFRTGDLGHVDAQGYLTLVGRGSEMIVLSGGENINPERVEERLAAQPAVREAGVLARGDRLVAVLVPDPGARRGTSDEELERAMRAAAEAAARDLPSHHRIARYVISHDALPRTRLGKLRRHHLEALYEDIERHGGRQQESPGPVPIEKLAPEDQQILQEPAARRTWDWLAERFSEVRLTPDVSPQFDLGVDSMAWLNLTLELGERLGVNLDDEAIGRIETVRDLLREVVEAGEGAGGQDPVAALRDPERLLDARRLALLRPPGPLLRLLRAVLARLNRLALRALFRLRVEGLERLPARGPYILAPNHLSYLDAPALGAALGPRLADTYWGGFAGLMFGNPLVRAFSRAAQVLPVDPAHGPLTSLAYAAAALRRGKILVWFPEGERSTTGELRPFQAGIALLLQAQEVPVIPVWIEGGYQAWPRGRRWPRLHPLRVIIGATTRPADLGAGAAEHDEVAQALRARVAGLAP